MFKLSEDYTGNGVSLKKGEYSQEELIKLYGSEDTFNFCFTCTDLGEYLKEENFAKVIEEKAIVQVPENKAILSAPENKSFKKKNKSK